MICGTHELNPVSLRVLVLYIPCSEITDSCEQPDVSFGPHQSQVLYRSCTCS